MKRVAGRVDGMAAKAEEIEVAGHAVRLTSRDRVIFPARGFTKGDVFEYYLAVGEGIMRALDRRPTTLQRFPEGVDGEAFFQKRVPARGVPPWLHSATIEFPSGRKADELCPTDLAHVAWAAQMGTIVFHAWPVRESDVDSPDELRIDLDPQPGTDFSDAATVAGELRAVLDELGWVGFPKTSGGRGMHVYVRIRPQWTFVQVRRAAIALAREVERRRPELVTTSWWKEERGRRVFLDSTRWRGTARSPAPTRCAPTSGPRSPPRWRGTRSPTWSRTTSTSVRCRTGCGASATRTPRSMTSRTI